MKKRCVMTLLIGYVLCISLNLSAETHKGAKDLCCEYIDAWKGFYPSRALSRGFQGSIFDFEDFSRVNIDGWLRTNMDVLEEIARLEAESVSEDWIDARLLRIHAMAEIEKWEKEAPHKNALSLYTDLIADAADRVLETELLMPAEKVRVLTDRLDGVGRLCVAAGTQLENGSPREVERSLRVLDRSSDFYEMELPEKTKAWMTPGAHLRFASKCRLTAEQIRELASHVRMQLIPGLTKRDTAILGREEFARRLRLFTDSDMTPEELEAMAFEEIQAVRGSIAQACSAYVREAYPGQKIPEDFDTMTGIALGDMEKNHPSSQQEYLDLWEGLAERAENFIRDKKIATLPDNRTLSIRLAPESSGPMARIGWVSPAPPFHPNPWTTIYLPNIPDSHPEEERMDFWRSFNNHFTTFIVIHELFPGHYIQSKINRENPHPVRILFPYGLYSEGWATLCEKVALDAGWDNRNKLTYLAHLRKRIENANRAYTSVQVHCNGWDREKVQAFSTGTSLLAPQFAQSLWGRLMSSPMQITSYFLGTQKFTELYESERKRLGEKFQTLVFMNTILRAGPIPLDEFPALFQRKFE